jgi:hypothetical protein
MKSPLIVLLAAVVACGLGAGVVWKMKSTQAAELAAQIAKLQADNAKLAGDAAAAAEKAKVLESESAQLRAARALSQTRLEPEVSPTPADDEQQPKGSGNFLARMFKNPEMRKFLASQQASVLRGFYSDFIKSANLTPDETDKFLELLSDRQMALMDSSANMMSGSAVDLKAATAATNASNDALKNLLGNTRFGMYQDYEKTLGDRMQVQQFSQQLGAQGMQLQDNQSKALIQIMSEEQANMQNSQPGNAAGLSHFTNMNQADVDRYAQQAAATNQRIYNRAMSILTPSQLTAFDAFQKNSAAMQAAAMKATQEMLKGDQ